MPVQRLTKMSQMTVDFMTGAISLKMEKQIIDDDGTILSNEPHRTTVAAGGDLDQQIGFVNSHLQQMRFAPVSADEIARLHSVFSLGWVDAARKEVQGPAGRE